MTKYYFYLVFYLIGTIICWSKPILKVAIDPGHTKKKYGALSSTNKPEYSYNIEMAKLIQKRLNNEANISAFIINPLGKKITLKERVRVAQIQGADIFISIHHDSVQPKYLQIKKLKNKIYKYTNTIKGYSIFISKKNRFYKKSFLIATNIANEFIKHKLKPTLHHAEKIKGENRLLLNKKLGIYIFDDLVVLKYAKMPAILIECGVIVNPIEEYNVKTYEFKEKIAKSIINGLKNSY